MQEHNWSFEQHSRFTGIAAGVEEMVKRLNEVGIFPQLTAKGGWNAKLVTQLFHDEVLSARPVLTEDGVVQKQPTWEVDLPTPNQTVAAQSPIPLMVPQIGRD